MPKISKIRITNAQLDNGDKTFGNKIWDLRDNNTLFLLENGGGKTSVIQMIHQVITPNVMIQKRKIHDTLIKNTTTHIAVEWTPDDTERTTFITGFTLYNHGKKKLEYNSRDYDYLSYIYEVEEENLALEELPFVVEGKVASLFDLGNVLKQTPGVIIFQNEVKRYTDVLESHGIFQNEWSNIAKINGGEGGIQEFFNEAKTVPSLISKLFVPSLEDNLYEEDQKNSVVDAFKKHKDALLDLPKMEKMLVDFEIVENRSEDIIKASEDYGVTEREYKISLDNMGSFHKTIHNGVKRMAANMSALKKKLQEMEGKEKDLKYAVASYPIYTEREKKESIEKKKVEYKEQIEGFQQEIRFYDGKIKEELALKEYKKYERKNTQLRGEETDLELMNMNNDERNKKFEESYRKVSSGNSYLKQKERMNQEQKDESLIALKQTIRTKKSVFDEKDDELREVAVKKSKLDAMVESYKNDRENIIRSVGDDWKGKVKGTLASLESRQTLNTNQLHDTENREKEIGEETIKLNETQIKSQADNQRIRMEEEKQNNQLNEYYGVRDTLNEELPIVLSMDTRGKLFQIKDSIEQKMNLRLQKNADKLFFLNVQRKNLETDLDIVKNDGFYVHPELKEVKEELYMKGLDLVLGTEYLLKLNLSKQDKEKIVQTNPLISFSIIVEESEVSKLKQAASRIKKNLSIPIFFLKRESLLSKETKEHFFAINDDNYVLERFESLLTENDWEKFRETKEKEMEDIAVQLEEVTKEKLRYEHINERMKQFYIQYDSKTDNVLLENLESLKEKSEEYLKIIKTCNEQIKKLGKEAECLTQKKKELNEKIKQDDRSINRMQDFLVKYQGIDSQKEKAKQMQLQLESLQKERKQQEKDLDDLRNEQESLKLQIQKSDQISEALNNQRIDFKLKKVENPKAINREQYERDLEILKQRHTEISSEESKKQGIRERIDTLKEEIKEITSEIKKLGYEITFLQNTNEAFDQRMLEEYELKRDINADDLNSVKEKISSLESDWNTSSQIIQFHLKELKKNYNKEEEFAYDGDPKVEFDYYSLELIRLDKEMEDLKEVNGQLVSTFHKYEIALENVEIISDQFTNKDDVDELEADEWNQKKPIDTFRELEKKIDSLSKQLKTRENKIEAEISTLMDNIKETKNSSLISMSHKFNRFLEQSKLDYDSLIEHFYTIIETTGSYKKTYELSKEEAKRSEDEVIDIMRNRSEALYSSIKEIEKNSIVDFAGDRKPTVKIRWERESDTDSTANFQHYIAALIDAIINLEKKETAGKEIEGFINKELRMAKILNCYAQLDKCDLKVWKPRNDILSGRVTYDHWDVAADWSGGETSSFKVTMFISFNNLLRKKKTSRENTSKVLIMDNPFGKASSKHVIMPMVDLARKTNTQLFCLTDINNDAVLNSFETVISNKYILHLGRASLQSEVTYKGPGLDSLVYSKEFL